MSKPGGGDDKLKVVDTTGEEFWYMPEQYVFAQGFSFRKWTPKPNGLDNSLIGITTESSLDS